MKRRTNKSHKVPNVKLRPAQGSYGNLNGASSGSSQCWAEDSQANSDDSRFLDNCPRPFRGVVVCATGVPDKTTLFKKALELGATSVPALTDKVTHLIAMEPGSAKYNCALQMKIPILSPSWITESYKIWLEGGDVELESSVEQHRLPIFTGVVLCFSGITDPSRRARIIKLVNQHGGTFMKLERPVRVTHLLCNGDEQTDKMRVAEKFNARREANIRLVWEEWFWDSLEHGGRFDEEAYLVQNPRPERRPAESLPSQVPESEPSRANSLQAEPQPPQRQPTMDLDDLEDEAASVNVVPAVRLQVWGGLLERRGYEVTDGEIVRSPTKSQPAAGPQQAKSNALPSINYRKAGGVIDAVRSTNSFAPAEPEAGPSTSQRPLPFKRHSTANSGPSRAGTPAIQPSRQPSRRSSGQAPGAVQEDVNAAGPSSPKPTSSPPMPQIFAGMRLCVLGEAKAATVKSAIEASGGVYVQEEDENVDFIIVRLFSGSKIYQSEPDPKMREKYRTECWLESCIHDERICHPDEHVSFLPLAINTPVPGAEKIQIGLSGLDQSQSCHTRRLLRALGINIIPLFTRKATHLLCPSGTGAKFEKAGEWGIPVVSYSWLQAIASSGTIPPADDYLVTGPPSAADKANDHSIDIKGKGKAVANDDVRMQDITNNIHESPLAQHAALPAEKPAPPLSKNNSLERQPTAIVPPHGSGGSVASGLGQPTELLGGPALSSFFAPSRSSAAPSQESPLVRYGTRPSSSVAHTIGDDLSVRDDDDLAPAMDQEPQRTQPSHPDGTPQRKSTLSIMSNNDDRDMMRIPSSKSPSPMKLPLRRHASKSPVKLDPGQTKLLHESIQSLLGKRGPPDAAAEQGGDEDPDSLQTVDSARNSKRKKGQRAKPPARPKAQRSRTTTTASRRSPPEPSPAPVDGISLGAFNYGVEEESQRLDEQQQSVRVVYEDPAQLEERQRLMNMLKANSQVEGSLPSSGSLGKTRRSARLSSGL